MTARDPRKHSGPPDGLSSLLRQGIKAAIARWTVLRRPAGEWPRPQDEAPHPTDGDPLFSEEFVFAAVQPELAVVARLEWLPARDAHRVWMSILTPRAVYALPGGQAVIRGDAERRWRAGGLHLDCLEPHRTWTLRFHGSLDVRGPDGLPQPEAPACEARLDLTFVAALMPYVPGTDDDPDLLARQLGAADWDTRFLRELRRRPQRAYLQSGDMHGTIALGEELRTFGGAAIRQHAWGARDWGASDRGMQCFAALGPLRAFVHTMSSPWLTLAGGFVHRPGGAVALRDLGVSAEQRPGRAPARVGLHVDAPGGPLDLEAESLAELPLEMDGTARLDFALVKVRGGDDARGWGLCCTHRRLAPRR